VRSWEPALSCSVPRSYGRDYHDPFAFRLSRTLPARQVRCPSGLCKGERVEFHQDLQKRWPRKAQASNRETSDAAQRRDRQGDCRRWSEDQNQAIKESQRYAALLVSLQHVLCFIRLIWVQSEGCVTCKAKRLKCDETKPTCQQCARRSVTCGGYKRDFKWRPFEEVNYTAKAPPGKVKKRMCSNRLCRR
jgi:hypothetical protein